MIHIPAVIGESKIPSREEQLALAVHQPSRRGACIMKLGYTAMAVVLAAGLVSAQEIEKKTKTKVKVDDGKSMTVTGCLERSPEGAYTLTNVSGKDGALGSYMLAATDDDDKLDDLDKHIGHRIEVEGKAADQGKGKIKVESKSEGTSGKTESKAEVKGDLKGLPYLGVKSFRMLATVCP
jgi:hypothetical protein